jgi:hypothetical protein
LRHFVIAPRTFDDALPKGFDQFTLFFHSAPMTLDDAADSAWAKYLQREAAFPGKLRLYFRALRSAEDSLTRYCSAADHRVI